MKKGFSLLTSIILTSFIGCNIYFFVVLRTTGLEEVAGWIMFVFFLWLYFMILHTGNVSKYRRMLLVASAILFVPSFVALIYEEGRTMGLTYIEILKTEVPFCHIVIPVIILPYILFKIIIFPARLTGHFASLYSMLGIWLMATLVIGRGWCSWICFFGGWDDGISRLSKKPVLKIDSKNNKVRFFNFAILIFVVFASLYTLTPVYCTWLCPFKLITEYEQPVNLSTYIAMIIFVLTFFGLVVVLPYLTRKRFQCMSFCPFGAFQSLMGFFSFYRLRINTEKCTQCLRCVSECPTMSLTEDIIKEKKGKPSITCTKCGECIGVCLNGAANYEFAICKTPKEKFWIKWLNKISLKDGLFNKILMKVIIAFDEILSPYALLTFSAFTFGMVICSGFGTGTIHRLLNLILKGSFLLK
ncbi:MAG: 4Fe-4S binding protein [Candidatus Firestonebacteria bacterium]